MSKNTGLTKFILATLFMTIAFVTTACSQQQDKNEKPKSEKVQSAKMTIDGMSCSACQSTVKRTMKSLEGVTHVEVSLENKIAYFIYDPKKIKPEQIQKAVNDKGYTAGKPQEVKQ